MKDIIKRIVVVLLIGLLLISSILLFKNRQEDEEQEIIFEEIQEIAQDNKNDIDMESLYQINNDIVGWLKIEDTNINYPVMQTKDRPMFYLRKDFYKNYSQWGTPFLTENCDINTSDNLIIYGHHINNSKMFGELENYRKQEFYKKHQFIKFYTMEEKREYEIISVFKTIANGEFKYYDFIKAEDKKEFDTFIDKCKELSFYDIQKQVQYGDKLLTLSTCDYSTKNGRLVVVAKMIL